MSNKRHQRVQAALERFVLSESELSPQTPLLSVSLEIYNRLHERFDRGEENVYSGKKDGTNRRLIRLNNGAIHEVEGSRREVLPLEPLIEMCKNIARNRQRSSYSKTQTYVRKAFNK